MWAILQSSEMNPVLKEIFMIKAKGIKRIFLYSFRMIAGML